MIVNGRDKSLSSQTNYLPDVSSAVADLLQPVIIGLINKTQVNGYTQEVQNNFNTRAVKQPFTSQQLAIKPEGERAWKWFTMHMLTDLELKVDDRFVFGGQRYRVMQKYNYAEYGYFQYEIIEDYQGREI